MKRNLTTSIVYTVITGLLLLPFADAHSRDRKKTNAGKQKTENIGAPIKGKILMNNKTMTENHFSTEDSIKIVQIVKRQDSCVMFGRDSCHGPDCSHNYCNNIGVCTEKIVCCHKISDNDFMLMTQDRTLGFAKFPVAKFRKVANSADCEKQCIRIRKGRSWRRVTNYYIKAVNFTDTPADASLEWKVYYSVPFIKGILAQDPDTICVYSGYGIIQNGVDPDKKLFPFEVRFPNKPSTFYDISDANP